MNYNTGYQFSFNNSSSSSSDSDEWFMEEIDLEEQILVNMYINNTRLIHQLIQENESNEHNRRRKRQRRRRRKAKMTLKKLDANPSTLESVLEELKSDETNRGKINFILFLADNDPTTNRSWCPDCVRAEPVIYKTLEESPAEVNLIRAYAGDRPTWRNPVHPWRVDPRFKLTGVPTLVRWDGESVKGRLEDHQAHVPRLILPLLSSSVSAPAT